MYTTITKTYLQSQQDINAALRANCFRVRYVPSLQVINTKTITFISTDTSSVLILTNGVSYFQFLLFSAFISQLTEYVLTSDSLIRNSHQRGASQHTVYVKELCTKALTGSDAESEYVSHVEVDHKGADFTGNKQTYRHSTLYFSTDSICSDLMYIKIQKTEDDCKDANFEKREPHH